MTMSLMDVDLCVGNYQLVTLCFTSRESRVAETALRLCILGNHFPPPKAEVFNVSLFAIIVFGVQLCVLQEFLRRLESIQP